MDRRFVSEAIQSIQDSIDFSGTPVGEPPLPKRFVWRDVEYTVDAVLERWKESGKDTTHGSKEKYLRKHWFHVRTTGGDRMKIYFERQAKSKSQRTARWWLYTISRDEDTPQT